MCIDYNNVRIDQKCSKCLNPFAIACSFHTYPIRYALAHDLGKHKMS